METMAQEWMDGNEALRFRAQAGTYSQQMNVERSMMANELMEQHRERAGRIGLTLSIKDILDGTMEAQAESSGVSGEKPAGNDGAANRRLR